MRPLLTGTLTTPAGWHLTAWAEPGNAAVPMQDALHCSHPRPGLLRVAAIDGCTPMPQTPTIAGVNGATYAAHFADGALYEHDPVPDLLRRINEHLFQLGPDLIPAARPSATAAAAELTWRDGSLRVDAWATGDAQVWVRELSGWRLLVGGPGCLPETTQAWATRLEALKATGTEITRLRQLEAEFFRDPGLFVRHTSLGRFERLRIQHESAHALEVVCATDGALLDAHALEDLDGWMEGLRVHEARGVARLKACDDLAVLRVSHDSVAPRAVSRD